VPQPAELVGIIIWSRSSSETAALESGIEAFGDFRPETDVCLYQRVEFGMIERPSLLAQCPERSFRSLCKLDPQFLVRRETAD